MAEVPTIPEWFRGKSVFITGGSGFIGKVLIWKILKSCPAVDTIYILLRPKRGRSVQERLAQLLTSPMFDNFRSTTPEIFNKLLAVEGDLKKPNLGLSYDDMDMLKERTSIVFHVGASVKFDDPLRDAVFTNLRSTQDAIKLAKGMKSLEIFVYVSTAYTNCDKENIKEELYPARGNWNKIISAAEQYEDSVLNIVEKKLLGSVPNTYIYTKSLAEHLVYHHKDTMPVVIFRPSVVCNSLKEPLKGWVDNINSLSGIAGGCVRGVLRVYNGPDGINVDYVPVDITVNGMIIAAWYRAVNYSIVEEPKTVFNCTTEKCTSREMMEYGMTVKDKWPIQNCLWEPYFIFTNSILSFTLLSVLLHFIPGLILDGLLKLSGQKTMFLRVYRIIYVTLIELHLFLSNNWLFETENFQWLDTILLPADRDQFHLTIKVADRDRYMWYSYQALRKYVFGDPEEITAAARKNRLILNWADRIARVLLFLLVVWLLPLNTLYMLATNYLHELKQFLTNPSLDYINSDFLDSQ